LPVPSKRAGFKLVILTPKMYCSYTYLDDDGDRILEVPIDQSFWARGGFDAMKVDNPWDGRPDVAPFDQPFYLVMNVAVGGEGRRCILCPLC
jgi:hypothetical protein